MGGLWLVLIGWFVLSAARAEELDATLRGKLAGLRAADVMSTPPVIAPSTMSVGEFIDEYLPKCRHSAYPVQDCDGRVLGVVTLTRAMGVDRRECAMPSLADVVIPLNDVPVAAMDDALVTFMPHRSMADDRRTRLGFGRWLRRRDSHRSVRHR